MSPPNSVETVEEKPPNGLEPNEREEAPDEGLSAHFPRLFEAFGGLSAAGKDAAGWIHTGLSLLDALQKLGRTLGKLLQKARRVAEENRADDAPSQHLIDAENWDEFREQFQELFALFPDAGELFFGADALDELIKNVFNPETHSALSEQVNALGRALDAELGRFVARLIEWGFEERAPSLTMERLSFERLEEFVRGLEALLQEILDRWVIARIYDLGEDDDSSQ